MTLSSRDKKLLTFLVPVILVVAYWFMLLAPARQEAAKLGDDLAKQEQTRDQLQAQVSQLGQARADFATDYATVVELGKAVPSTVDMPSLIVQLDKAAHGTGIAFERINAGDRLPAGAAAAPAAGKPPVAAGGEKASTGEGKATEKANDTKAQGDSAAAAPPAGATPPPAGSGKTSGVPGLDTVPLEFTFRGDFFELADFFHRLKRFVHVASDGVDVRGRLMTIEGLTFKAAGFPRLEAQVTANVYLAPKQEGATAGATPRGPGAPAGAPEAASAPAPAPSGGPPAAAVAR